MKIFKKKFNKKGTETEKTSTRLATLVPQAKRVH